MAQYNTAGQDINPVPPPSERCLEEMGRQNITPQERVWMIQSTRASQALSNLPIPMDVATDAFEEALFSPMPDIGNTHHTSHNAPGAKE
jgi:hypothetical protein